MNVKTGNGGAGVLDRAVSAAAGAGLVAYGLSRRGWKRGLSLAAGGDLLTRALSGESLLCRGLGLHDGNEQARDHKQGIRISESVSVDRPPQDLYNLWRDVENLPRFMRHVEAVHKTGDKTSHWRVSGPAGIAAEWDAEIVRDIPGRLITWQSLENASVVHAGSVSFHRMAEQESTEVKVVLRYDPPAGVLGEIFASLFNEKLGAQVREDILRFKETAEMGQGFAPAGPAPEAG
jgi:uncharacterized membrane protein